MQEIYNFKKLDPLPNNTIKKKGLPSKWACWHFMFYHLQAADSRVVGSMVNRKVTDYCTCNSTTLSKKLRRKGIKILILLQRKLRTCGRHTECTAYQLSELHFNRSYHKETAHWYTNITNSLTSRNGSRYLIPRMISHTNSYTCYIYIYLFRIIWEIILTNSNDCVVTKQLPIHENWFWCKNTLT